MNKKHLFGYTALFFGIASLGFSLFYSTFGPIEKPPSISQVASEKAGEIKKSIFSKLGREEVESEKAESAGFSKDKLAKIVIVSAAFFSIIFSIFSFIKEEDQRIYSSAVVLASGAVFFHFKIAGVVILLMFLFLILLTKGSENRA